MNIIKLNILIFVLLFSFLKLFPSRDNETDSLLTVYKNEKDKEYKVKLLLKIGMKYENNIPDSGLYYYKQALSQSNKLKNSFLIASSIYRIGNVYEIIGNLDTAMYYYKKAKKIFLIEKDTKGIANCYNGIGNIYYYKSQFKKTLEYYHKALNLFEKLPNREIAVSYSYHNIGLVFHDLRNYEKAMKYYKKALKIFEKENDLYWMSTCYNSIGGLYFRDKKHDKAIEYYNKSLNASIIINDKNSIATEYSNLGRLYLDLEDYNKALEYFIKSEELSLEMDNEYGLTDIYLNLSDLYIHLGYYNKAINYGKKGLKLSKNIGSLYYQQKAYKFLSYSYSSSKNFKNAYRTSHLEKVITDSIYNIEKSKEIEKLETIYQTEKKELQIENQNKEIIAQKEREEKATILLISSGIVIILVSFFAIFIYRSYKHKKHINKVLGYQKQQISEKNEELNQQNEEIKTQRDEIENQKNKLQVIHEELTGSIRYAERIQNITMPDNSLLNKYVKENFVLFKPKDVVSGDFFWFTHINNMTFIAAADCTGHGVPGGFMSMLGITKIKEIIIKDKAFDTGKILDKLREEIISTLRQREDSDKSAIRPNEAVKDGMDMSLIKIDHKNNILEISGANNPVYLIRDKKEIKNLDTDLLEKSAENENKLLLEIKPDKMPISVYSRMDNFSNTKLEIKQNDVIYLFSDGYADQFGGNKGRKFKYKPLKKLLLANADKKMDEQKKILNNVFEDWKGDLEQIDDVLLMGVRI